MEKEIDFEYRDILKTPLSEDELVELANLGSMTIKNLVNKNSRGFKNLKIDFTNLSDDEAAQLILTNPKIMTRPLFSDGLGLAAGFKEEEVVSLIEGK